MKYMDEFRDKQLIDNLVVRLHTLSARDFTFMEVCGGHTAAIQRFGLTSLLPENYRLISGPGCPVCVTSRSYIDKALICSSRRDFIIATFGDLIRVPGSFSTLEKAKGGGADVRIVFSPMDAVDIAVSEPGKKVIFLAIGFETTAPGTALAIKRAARLNLPNFFVLCSHKVMPPAMEALCKGGAGFDGFICPGHVSAITGSDVYNFIPRKYKLGCVVAGFEPTDLLQAVYMLARQSVRRQPKVEIQYTRVVTREGNVLAQKHMNDVFTRTDSVWRGLGRIELSGLKISDMYSFCDADRAFPVEVDEVSEDDECICGEILRGKARPVDCRLFGRVCVPETPLGACMVSSEGSCQIYYRYNHYE